MRLPQTNRAITRAAISLFVVGVAGAIAALWMEPGDYPWALKVVGGLWLLVLLFIKIVVQEVRTAETYRRAAARLAEAEARFKEHPDRPDVIWDLARTKLESYIDRNLEQVRRIFFLTTVVLVAGLLLVASGVYGVYRDPTFLTSSIVAATAGTLTEVIGATLLVVYRSVMKRADTNIVMLERMSVVGMAMQILDHIDDRTLREKKLVEIAGELLNQYRRISRVE